MGQKDIAEKILEAHNDVFADIVNVLLFNGEEIIKPNELEEQAPRSAYKADGKFREIERDVAKRWKNGNVRVACIGIENQTESDADMPLRIIGYDGAEYRAQLNDGNADRYPVITLVLYFGQKHWDKPLSLIDALNIPEHLKPFVNDYRVNLFEVAFMDADKVNMFKSDFKVVADYFVQIHNTGKYIGNAEQLTHFQETFGLMSVLTKDRHFEDVINTNNTAESGKEIKTMFSVFDEAEAKGRAEGKAEGIAEGIRFNQIEVAHNLYTMGWALNDISKVLNVELEQLKEWLGVQPS